MLLVKVVKPDPDTAAAAAVSMAFAVQPKLEEEEEAGVSLQPWNGAVHDNTCSKRKRSLSLLESDPPSARE